MLNPCDGVFSPFERAQDLLKSQSGSRTAWNAPHTTGHDSQEPRAGRMGGGRPSSSLGPRTSVKPHSTSEVGGSDLVLVWFCSWGWGLGWG